MHVCRIGFYVVEMGCFLGWDWDVVECIEVAVSMYDIGKIGVLDAIF